MSKNPTIEHQIIPGQSPSPKHGDGFGCCEHVDPNADNGHIGELPTPFLARSTQGGELVELRWLLLCDACFDEMIERDDDDLTRYIRRSGTWQLLN